MNLADADALIEVFREIAPREPDPPTIMELSGYPHWETVCSNLLAFFLDPSSPHGLESLCLDALLDAAGLAGERPPLSDVTVEREVGTNAGNKLDILIISDSHVIAVENKIFAPLDNPLADYAVLAADKARKGGCTVVKILLALYPLSVDPGHGFVWVSYEGFFKVLRNRLGQQNERADDRYCLYLTDFVKTIENLKRGTRMDADLLTFLRERGDDVTKLLNDVRSFKKELRQQVSELGLLIDVRSQESVMQFFWREPDKLADLLVYDVAVSPSLTVAVDTIISPAGWHIEMYNRKPPASMKEVRELLERLKISFKEIKRGQRLLHLESFDYGAPIEDVRSCLQRIIDALVSDSDHRGGATPPRPVVS